MDFGDNNILHNLERPPSRNNLSVYNIIQAILMICLGLSAGYNLIILFREFSFSKSELFSIFIDTLIFVGLCLSCFGFLKENNKYLKGGFILFWLGCILLLLKIIIAWFLKGFTFSSLIPLLIVFLLVFVISKQIQHI